MTDSSRYAQIMGRVFLSHYEAGAHEVEFEREEMVDVADDLGIKLPKNLGDIVYSFRYRRTLPDPVLTTAPEGKEWIIRPAGRGRYRFVLVPKTNLNPNEMLSETKVPDATPGIVAKY